MTAGAGAASGFSDVDRGPEVLAKHVVDGIGVEPSEVGGDRGFQRFEVLAVGAELSEVDATDLDARGVCDPEARRRLPPKRRLVADRSAPQPVTEAEPPLSTGLARGEFDRRLEALRVNGGALGREPERDAEHVGGVHRRAVGPSKIKVHTPRSCRFGRMLYRLRHLAERAYRRHLRREIDDVPTHVAIIQDGNRRYARERGDDAPDGHRAGAATTERVLDWCADLGVAELTLYAFSTENFERPDGELEPLFDLLTAKLREFADADRVHDQGVRVRAIGDVDRLPERVRDAVAYAERRTADNDQFTLNVALAYGGRTELLDAATAIARDVDAGTLDPEAVDTETVESRLYDRPVRDVDLIVRTGGDERTSNFLPWHANGNEAAVYFCAPYWPEFSEVEFLRAIRTYQSREQSWRHARAERAAALVRAVAEVELAEAQAVAGRLRSRLSTDADALPDVVAGDSARGLAGNRDGESESAD